AAWTEGERADPVGGELDGQRLERPARAPIRGREHGARVADDPALLPPHDDRCATGAGWLVQVAPPSSVRRITPSMPTAQPRRASTKCTPKSVDSTGACCWRKVRPPSSLAMMVPNSPTTQT